MKNLFHYSQARLYDSRWITRTTASGRVHRAPAHSNTLRMLMGMKDKAKLPEEGTRAVMIQGVSVAVRPIERFYKSPRRAHRLVAICPHCGDEMSAGRLNQHVCKEETKKWWAGYLAHYYLRRYGEAV